LFNFKRKILYYFEYLNKIYILGPGDVLEPGYSV